MVAEEKIFAVMKPSFLLAAKEVIIFIILFALFWIHNFHTPDFLFEWNVSVDALIMLSYLLLIMVVVSFIVLVIKLLKLHTTVFTITDEQILYRHGILNVKREYMEIYRIKDFSVFSPFFLRIFALSNLVIHSSDKTHPVLLIQAIRNQSHIYNGLRERVETMRRIKGVREFD